MSLNEVIYLNYSSRRSSNCAKLSAELIVQGTKEPLLETRGIHEVLPEKHSSVRPKGMQDVNTYGQLFQY